MTLRRLQADQAGSGAGALGEHAGGGGSLVLQALPRLPRSGLSRVAAALKLARPTASVALKAACRQAAEQLAERGSVGKRRGEARSAEPFPRYMQIKRRKRGGQHGKDPA